MHVQLLFSDFNMMSHLDMKLEPIVVEISGRSTTSVAQPQAGGELHNYKYLFVGERVHLGEANELLNEAQ